MASKIPGVAHLIPHQFLLIPGIASSRHCTAHSRRVLAPEQASTPKGCLHTWVGGVDITVTFPAPRYTAGK
jgi:hypothetical protein